MKWRGRFLLLVGLVLVAGQCSLPTVDASVVFGPTPTSSPAPSPVVSSPGSGTRSGSSGAATVSNCHLYAEASGFGKSCFQPGTTSTGHVLTIAEILGGDPLPVCWDDALTAGDLAAAHVQNAATYTWFWQKCLTGIGPAPSYVIGPGGVKIANALIALPTGSTPPGLTANQQRLVGMYAADVGDYPPVVAIPAPSGKPESIS